MNLDAFFDMWFHSKGYPILSIDFSFDKKKGLGSFTIKQDQIDKEQGIEAFEFDLEVKWCDKEGAEASEKLHVSKTEQVFKVKMSEPEYVAIDPEMKALFEMTFKPGDDLLLALLEKGSTVREVMQAVTALAKTGKRKHIKAIADHLASEERWGVRIHCYRELSSIGNAIAFETLSELLLTEKDPMVLEHAAQACGKHRHTSLAKALRTRLADENLPYRGQMALLNSLGAQGDPADIELLRTAAQSSGWRDLIKAGAYLGLGASHLEEACEPLLDGMDDPVHFFDAKIARVMGLGSLRDWLPSEMRKRVDQALINATHDPSYFVKVVSARTIAGAGVKAGAPSLDALFAVMPTQDHPMLKKLLSKLASAGGEKESKKLQKQLDSLKEKLAEMEKRLQEVEPE